MQERLQGEKKASYQRSKEQEWALRRYLVPQDVRAAEGIWEENLGWILWVTCIALPPWVCDMDLNET